MSRRDIIRANLLESRMKYLGQCDQLRMKSVDNEKHWQAMMQQKIKIPLLRLKGLVDFAPLLDDDETTDSYLKDRVREDSSTAAYKSKWGNKPAVFLQTAGFEFIWVGKEDQ